MEVVLTDSVTVPRVGTVLSTVLISTVLNNGGTVGRAVPVVLESIIVVPVVVGTGVVNTSLVTSGNVVVNGKGVGKDVVWSGTVWVATTTKTGIFKKPEVKPDVHKRRF